MKHHILGIRSFAGTSKKTNKPFDSYILHTTVEGSTDVEYGVAVKDLFVDKSLLQQPVRDLGGYAQLVGLDIEVDRNEYGFITQVKVIY